MRILLVAHGFPPTSLGGTEIYTRDLALALHRGHGHEVWVLTREADPARPEHGRREEDHDGLRVVTVNNTFRACRSFADTYRSPDIRRLAGELLDRVRPAVAHIQHLTCLSTGIVDELAARGIPSVLTLNDYWMICHRGQLLDVDLCRCPGPQVGCGRCILPHAGGGDGFYRVAGAVRWLEGRLPGRLARPLRLGAERTAGGLARLDVADREGERRRMHMLRIAGAVDHIQCPSRTLRDRFVAFGIPPERLTLVEQGIDHGPLSSLADRAPRPPGRPLRIGFLGSMIESKAPHVLLEAFAGLPEGAATLEIYGGLGSYHGDDGYRARVAPLLDRPGVRHHGPVPRERVAEAFAGVDVLAVPSVWLENAPFVIREAFVAGVPVVASGHGGMAEMVRDGVDGLLFEPGDPASLRDALTRVVEEPGLLERLRAGRPAVPTIEQDAARHDGLSRELAAHARRARRPRLAAVVLNYRTPRDTALAVRSLTSSRRPPDDVVVVDNGSDDGSAGLLSRLEGCRLVETGANLGFSGGANAGIRTALGGGAERVLLLNGDVMLAGDAVGALETALRDERVGIAGALVLDRADPLRIASAGMSFNPLSGRMRHRLAGAPQAAVGGGHPVPVAAVMGCATLIRASVLEETGGFDDDFFFSFEDLDLCLRAARCGFRTVCVPDAVAYHAGSRSIGTASPARLYFATRNHLLVARRSSPLTPPLGAARTTAIVLLNLAHAVSCGWMPAPTGLRACLRGAWHHLRRRYGPMPEGLA